MNDGTKGERGHPRRPGGRLAPPLVTFGAGAITPTTRRYSDARAFGAATTLRIAPIDDLVPPRELRVIGVGEMLGDYALKVSFDDGSK
jgi:hypothetical protein